MSALGRWTLWMGPPDGRNLARGDRMSSRTRLVCAMGVEAAALRIGTSASRHWLALASVRPRPSGEALPWPDNGLWESLS